METRERERLNEKSMWKGAVTMGYFLLPVAIDDIKSLKFQL